MTRRREREVLLVHRTRQRGGYWHVVAGGVESGETAIEAAERELREETGLAAEVWPGIEVVEYADALTGEPAEWPAQRDRLVVAAPVACFHAEAPDEWEPTFNGEHDDHRWYVPVEAARALRWPATAQALQRMLTDPESGIAGAE